MEKFKNAMAKVGDWFKWLGSKIKDGAIAVGKFAKKLWDRRYEPVKPIVAWSVIGGVVVLAVVLALIFWL